MLTSSRITDNSVVRISIATPTVASVPRAQRSSLSIPTTRFSFVPLPHTIQERSITDTTLPILEKSNTTDTTIPVQEGSVATDHVISIPIPPASDDAVQVISMVNPPARVARVQLITDIANRRGSVSIPSAPSAPTPSSPSIQTGSLNFPSPKSRLSLSTRQEYPSSPVSTAGRKNFNFNQLSPTARDSTDPSSINGILTRANARASITLSPPNKRNSFPYLVNTEHLQPPLVAVRLAREEAARAALYEIFKKKTIKGLVCALPAQAALLYIAARTTASSPLSKGEHVLCYSIPIGYYAAYATGIPFRKLNTPYSNQINILVRLIALGCLTICPLAVGLSSEDSRMKIVNWTFAQGIFASMFFSLIPDIYEACKNGKTLKLMGEGTRLTQVGPVKNSTKM